MIDPTGGIGQPLSLLLKLNPLVSHLSLYDIRLAAGVAADVGHCNTPSTVSLFTPMSALSQAHASNRSRSREISAFRNPANLPDGTRSVNKGQDFERTLTTRTVLDEEY